MATLKQTIDPPLTTKTADEHGASKPPSDRPALTEDEEVNLEDFQAQLVASLDNVHRIVESWIPQALRTSQALDHSGSKTSQKDFSCPKPRSSRLGLGSSKLKQSAAQVASSSKLHGQLTKKAKTEENASKELIGSREEVDEEDSRTLAFSNHASRRNPSSSLLHPPARCPTDSKDPSEDQHQSSNPEPSSARHPVALYAACGGLSKRQLKKQRKLERLRLAAGPAVDASGPASAKASESDKITTRDSSNASSPPALWTPRSCSNRTTPESQDPASTASKQPEPMSVSSADADVSIAAPDPSQPKKNKKRKRKQPRSHPSDTTAS